MKKNKNRLTGDQIRQVKQDKIDQLLLRARSATPSRDAWLGEGGNPRTGQAQLITDAGRSERTRHTLDTHEKEQNKRDADTYAPDGEADRLNPLQQMGRMANINEFMTILKRINPNFIFEVSIRDASLMNIYIMQDGFNIRTGHRGRYKKQVAALPNNTGANGGMMPEFSIMGPRMEEKYTADGQVRTAIKHAYEKERGWRTVLAKLFKSGLITETQIMTYFKPHLGRSSALWQKQVNSAITI